MTDSPFSTSRRLLRILVGGSILAAAWVAFDLITHSEAASAVETIDIAPIGSDIVSDVVSPAVTNLASIAAELPLEPVVAVGGAATEAMATVVAPPLAVITPVVETIAEPLAPVVAPLIPVVDGVVGALPRVPQLAILPSLGVLFPGDDFAVVLPARTSPLNPSPPVGGIPHDLPAVPPSADQPGGFAAVLSADGLAPPGWALTGPAATSDLPVSLTFGFDTSPD